MGIGSDGHIGHKIDKSHDHIRNDDEERGREAVVFDGIVVLLINLTNTKDKWNDCNGINKSAGLRGNLVILVIWELGPGGEDERDKSRRPVGNFERGFIADDAEIGVVRVLDVQLARLGSARLGCLASGDHFDQHKTNDHKRRQSFAR